MCTLVGRFIYRTQNSSDGTEPFDVNSFWNGYKLTMQIYTLVGSSIHMLPWSFNSFLHKLRINTPSTAFRVWFDSTTIQYMYQLRVSLADSTKSKPYTSILYRFLAFYMHASLLHTHHWQMVDHLAWLRHMPLSALLMSEYIYVSPYNISYQV